MTLFRKLVKLLTSAKLAIVLIAFVGAWSTLATMVPQEATQPAEYAEWAAHSPSLVPIVRGVGLHRAFGAPVFVAVVVLLALSSAVCAWNRSRSAVLRSRRLREAAEADRDFVAASPDITIPIADGRDEQAVLAIAGATLCELGVKTRRRDGVLSAVTPWWAIWGSAIFHWALVALVVTVFMGMLLRSEGSMPVPVGDQRPDQEDSYISVESGSLHRWDGKDRVIRVDEFDPAVEKDGLDLGAVPTIAVIDGDGEVLVRQQVYPNKKLHSGSLSIYQPTVGLTVRLALTTKSGKPLPEVVQLVDFSQEETGGTYPVQPMVLSNNAGQVILRMEAMVPLDPDPRGGYGEWIPKRPAARVILTDGDDHRILDEVVAKGESAEIEGGGTLKLVDIGWYSSLVLVDDPTIPYIYATMILALLGLTLSVSTRQQSITVAVVPGPEAARLLVRARLWRYVPTTIDEMREALESALADDEEGPHT